MSSGDKMEPWQAIRLLRAKVGELEHRFLIEAETLDEPMTTLGLNMLVNGMMADIALVAQLLADHIERSERHDEQLRQMYGYAVDNLPLATQQRLRQELGDTYPPPSWPVENQP